MDGSGGSMEIVDGGRISIPTQYEVDLATCYNGINEIRNFLNISIDRGEREIEEGTNNVDEHQERHIMSIIGASKQLLRTLEGIPEIGDPAPEPLPENINVLITLCKACGYSSSDRKDDTRGAEIEKVLGEAGRYK